MRGTPLPTVIVHLPTGGMLAGLSDGMARLIDAGAARPRVWRAHDGPILGAVLVSPRRLVTWSTDPTPRLWDLSRTACLGMLEGHSAPIRGITVLPGTALLSWSEDGTLRIWCSSTGEARACMAGHRGPVECVRVFPDGKVLSLGQDGDLRIFDVTSGGCLATLSGYGRACPAGAASDATGGRDGARPAQAVGSGSRRSTRTLLRRMADLLDPRRCGRRCGTGLSWRLPELDQATGGFIAGELTIVGGESSTWAADLALAAADDVASRQGRAVGILGIARDRHEILRWVVSRHARIEADDLRHGRLTQGDFQRLLISAGCLWDSPLAIEDAIAATAPEVRSRALRLRGARRIEALFVLGLDVIDSLCWPGTRERSERAAWALKGLASEMEVPIIAVFHDPRALQAPPGTGRAGEPEGPDLLGGIADITIHVQAMTTAPREASKRESRLEAIVGGQRGRNGAAIPLGPWGESGTGGGA